jgi:hypothetical protein
MGNICCPSSSRATVGNSISGSNNSNSNGSVSGKTRNDGGSARKIKSVTSSSGASFRCRHIHVIDGRPIQLYTLTNKYGLTVEVPTKATNQHQHQHQHQHKDNH